MITFDAGIIPVTGKRIECSCWLTVAGTMATERGSGSTSLQEAFSDRFGLQVKVCHYTPPSGHLEVEPDQARALQLHQQQLSQACSSSTEDSLY